MKKKHLLYINLDGFAYYYFKNSEDRFPVLKKLASQSVFFSECFSGIPSITVPMQVSIVSGCTSASTHNCYQYYDRTAGSVVYCARNNDSRTAAQVLEENGCSVLSVQQFAVEDHGCRRDDPEHLYIQPGGDCCDRFRILIEYYRSLRAGGIEFDRLHDMVLFYCDDLDAVGHNAGGQEKTEESRVEAVRSRLEMIDCRLAEVLSVWEEKGLSDSCVMLITSDHGMVQYKTPSLLGKLEEDLSSITGFSVSDTAGSSSDIFLLPSTIQAQLYFTGNEYDQETLKAELEKLDYVDRVMTKSELEASCVWSRFADMLISPVEGCAFYKGKGDEAEGLLLASHDSLCEKAQHVFALIWNGGAGAEVIKEKTHIWDLMNIALGFSNLPQLRGKENED